MFGANSLARTRVRWHVGFNWVSWWNSGWRTSWRTLSDGYLWGRCWRMWLPWQLGVLVQRLDCASQCRHQFVSLAKNIDSPLSSEWSISFGLPPRSLTQFNLKWCSFLSPPPAQFPLSGYCASSCRQVRWMLLNAEWVRQSWQMREDCSFPVCCCFCSCNAVVVKAEHQLWEFMVD